MINNKEHIKNLLQWIHDEVCSASGDGDAYWIVGKFYEMKDILELVHEVNESLGKWKWEIEYNEQIQEISWGQDQEWAIITKDSEFAPPSWAQCVIIL
jgi:hypothetical protein